MPAICDYHVDISKNPRLESLYEDPSAEDGYFRDACVFREEIDIPDTMSAAILYENGVQIAYSLNSFMPIEGYHLAFNGRRGPHRDPPVRAPALGDARPRRDPGDQELRRRWSASSCRTSRAATSAATWCCAGCCSSRACPIRSGSGPDARAGAMSVLCGVAAGRACGRTGRCRSPS